MMRVMRCVASNFSKISVTIRRTMRSMPNCNAESGGEDHTEESAEVDNNSR